MSWEKPSRCLRASRSKNGQKGERTLAFRNLPPGLEAWPCRPRPGRGSLLCSSGF